MQLQTMLKLKMGWAEPRGPHPDIILSSRIRLARNLRGQPFSPAASPRSLAAVLDAAFDAARKSRALGTAAFLKLEELDPADRVFLFERRLISSRLAAEPKLRGAVAGEREILGVMVNEEDHLRLQAVDSGLGLKPLWEKLDALDDELSGRLEYAVHPDWGHLTSCPTNAGTGLRASALAHLPGLAFTGRLDRAIGELSRLGLTVRGTYGEGTKIIGDFFQVSNAASLGKSETEIVEDVSRSMEGIIAREKESRQALAASGQKLRLEDMVYRSLGTLSHARSISFEETMQHLSRVRMAVSLGWKVGTDLETLNELMVLTQPGHIQMSARKELDPRDRDVLRAALLRHKFK